MNDSEEKHCYAHSDRESVTNCSWCGKHLCNECIVKSKGKNLCSGCARAIGLKVKIVEPSVPPEIDEKPILKPVIAQESFALEIKGRSLPQYMVLAGLVGALLIAIGAGLYYYYAIERYSIDYLFVTGVLIPILWFIVTAGDIFLAVGFLYVSRKWSDNFLLVTSISWGLNIVWRFLYPTPWETLMYLAMYLDATEFLSRYPEWFIHAHLFIIPFVISGIAFLMPSSKLSKNTFTKTTGYVLVIGSLLYLITDFLVMLRIPNVVNWVFDSWSIYIWSVPNAIALLPLLLLQIVSVMMLLPFFAALLGRINIDSLRARISGAFPFFIFIGFSTICFGIILDRIALMDWSVEHASICSTFLGPIGALLVIIGGLLYVRYREVTGEVRLKDGLMRERISFVCLLLGIVLFWIGMLSFLYYIPWFSFTSLGEASGLILLTLAGYIRRSLHVPA
jgi:hypothetical protein